MPRTGSMTHESQAGASSATLMRPELSVVVVDDNEDARLLLALLLRRAGCQVVGEAADGVEAIAAVAKLRPGFVVMDLMMPVLDGAAATEEIRRRWPEVCVVGYSDAPGNALKLAGASAQFDKSDTAGVIEFITRS